eukprot:scaffold97652_cov66-Phaeocystis_antarctica.AAC.6
MHEALLPHAPRRPSLALPRQPGGRAFIERRAHARGCEARAAARRRAQLTGRAPRRLSRSGARCAQPVLQLRYEGRRCGGELPSVGPAEGLGQVRLKVE